MKKAIIDLLCLCGKPIPQGRKNYCSDECRSQGNLLRTRTKRAGNHVHNFQCTGCGVELTTGRPRKQGQALTTNRPRERNKPLCGGSLAKGVPQSSLKLRKSGGITLTICRQKAWFGRTFTNVPNRDNFEFPIPHLNMDWPDGNMVHFVCKLSSEVELKAYAKSDGTS